MNDKKKGNKKAGIIMTVLACLLLFVVFPAAIVLARTDSFKWGGLDILTGVAGMFVGIPLLIVGTRNILTAGYEDIWMTEDARQTNRLLKKVRKIGSDTQLSEIAGKALLEPVAEEAIARIVNPQTLLALIFSYGIRDSRKKLAVHRLNDENLFAEVVTKPKTGASNEVRIEALNEIKDLGRLETIAKNMAVNEEVRLAAYGRLRVLTADKGWDVSSVDRTMAWDRNLPVKERAHAFQRLEDAGQGGDMLLARDSSMPAELRAEAAKRLGDEDKAKELLAERDYKLLFGTQWNERREAGKRIIQSGNRAMVERCVTRALSEEWRGNGTMRDFLVDAAQAYPDLIKKQWPRIRGWYHEDQTKHRDGHFDNSHTDNYVENSYVKNRHYDYMNSSDCTHSDSANENIHTDNSNEYYLNKFPPAVREN